VENTTQGEVLIMATKQLGTRHDEGLIASLVSRAELLNSSLTQLANDGLELRVGFDDRFFKGLKGLAADLGISPSDLIQRRLADWMGKIDAHIEIYGEYPHLAIDTASTGDFEEDFSRSKNSEIEKLEREIIKHAYEVETLGGKLEDYQKRLMTKYRLGKAWAESKECRKEAEMQQYIQEEHPDAVVKLD
jgi:hypothetical protein